MSDIVPLITMLVVVIVILYMSYMFTRYIGTKTIGSHFSKYMKLVDTLPIAQDKAVVIIDVSGKLYMLGVSPTAIHLIDELEEIHSVKPSEQNKPDFRQSLKKVLGDYKK